MGSQNFQENENQKFRPIQLRCLNSRKNQNKFESYMQEYPSLVEEIRIGKNHGIYVEKGSEHSIVWGNPDTEQVFTMVSNGLEKIDMEKAAEKIC